MREAPGEAFRQGLAGLDPSNARFATEVVELVLARARGANASDIHLTPTPEGLEIRWRIDGVLHLVGRLPAGLGPNVVARLKVLSELLTYRIDMPQEGRIRTAPGTLETRVSTFPTLHGEKAVIRMFAASDRYARLDDLGLPETISGTLRRLLGETSGMIVLSGPAGSGKTTTLYACLREIVAVTAGSRSLATLEDPIEVAVPGVSQSQVNPAAGFTLETGLRSLMRQDPEVIGVGEIRDRATAEVAFQASLTGHLVLTTFHAGSAAGALGRLADMGLEPYLLRSGLRSDLPEAGAAAVHVRGGDHRPGRLPRTARDVGTHADGVPFVQRNRLPGPSRAGRVCPTRSRRDRAGRPGARRRGGDRSGRGSGSHEHAMGGCRPRCRARPDRAGRGAAGAGIGGLERMDSRFQIPDSRCQIPDARFQIPDARFQMPDSRFRIPDARCRMQKDAERSGIRNRESGIRNPPSHPAAPKKFGKRALALLRQL